MPFDTYATLQTTVIDWLHRDNLAAKVPDFIALAEAAINRKLNIAPKEVDVPLAMTPGSRYVTYPTSMSEPIALWDETSQPRSQMTPMLPETLPVNNSVSGRPKYWAIDGARLAFERPADSAYSLTFRYVQDTNLSNANPTNAVLTRAPDLYLYGALAQAAPYMRDDARIGFWKSEFARLLSEVHADASRAKAIAPLMTEVPHSTTGTARSRRY